MRTSTALTRSQVIALIFKEQGEKSLRQYALEKKVSVMYLSDLLHGKREPGRKILGPIGVRKVRSVSIRYERVKA